MGEALDGLHPAGRLLSASSHSVATLETYQAFSGGGRCVDCTASQAPLGLTRAEVSSRWETIGMLMSTSDLEFVLAAPLRWRGTTLGGLNLFWSTPPMDPETVEAQAQVFADILGLSIVNSDPIAPAAARRLVGMALELRTVVEQAKGVLAVHENLDVPAAYLRLQDMGQQLGLSLAEVARHVIEAAQANGGSPGFYTTHMT